MEKRKRNGLEVTCIGALYQGAWEKKYWSRSRGKDRYPYPVGYQAVRCYNGHSFHMEVYEGGRGPLFVVSLGDGMTFSGDTPTIAWQRALKKASSLSKNMPGRFSSTEINGSELFGFLDPLVQRLFRELVSLQDGEAQPDDNLSLDNKADKVFQQKSIKLGSPEGFHWGSTRTAPVRKPRTSIVHSETNVSSLCRESSLNHPSQLKGGRKRLKLAKPSKKTREDTALELSAPSNLASLQGGSAELSQCKGEGREQNIMSAKMPQDHSCLGESAKATDLVQEHQKKEVLQGAVVPDSFDEFPSQFSAGWQGIKMKLSLVNMACDVRDKNLAPTSSADACLPSQGLSPSLSNSGACDKLQSFKEEVHINSSQKKLLNLDINSRDRNSLSKSAMEVQFTNAVVPDSCDNDSGVMQINGAQSPTQAVVDDSQIIGEQNVAEVDKCDNSPPSDAKDDSPSSEGNTQRGESDSLGQELTKSMIRLLLPQALQLIGKKKMRRKKPTTLKVVNQKEQVELFSEEEKLAGSDKNKPCFPTSFPNQLEDARALDSKSFPCEGIVNISAEGDEIRSGTAQLQLQNEGLDQCSSASICGSGFLKMVDESCLEKLDKVNDEPINDSDPCNAQPSKNRECLNADLANLAHQQAQREIRYQLVSCTAVSCDNTVLPHKNASLESSAVQTFPPQKQQDYDVNDTASAPLLYCSPKSHLVEDEYRNSPNHCTQALEHSCPEHLEICLPSPKSLKVVESNKELSTGIEAVTVEKSSMQFKTNDFLKESVVPNFGSEASATGEGTSIIVTGEDLSAPSSAFGSDELPQKHSVESIVVQGLLTCQEMNDLNHKETKCVDGRVEHVSKDSSRVHSLQTEVFVPKACLEHPMPVLAIKINVRDDQAHFFICCGVQNHATRVLFLYQTAKKEFKASLISSITFDILDYMSDAVCKERVEVNGIQFTPNGQELLLLGMFIVRETTKEKHVSLVQQHMCFHGLQVVSYADGKVCVHTRLDTSGRQVYCVLLLDTFMVIAGGDNGFVTCWTMDALWRSCKENFTLPVPEGHQFSRVVQLSGVPALPWIAIGCDHRGFIAIWNSASCQLLRVSKLSVQSPLEIHLLNIDLVVPNSCDELSEDTSMMSIWRKDGNDISEKVAASFLVSTLDCDRMAPGESDVQFASEGWSLELFKRNGSSAVFELNQLRQRVSTVEVLDGLGVAGTNDGYVHLWDLRSGLVRSTFSELKGEPIACIARDQACSILAVAGNSGRVLLYTKQRESASNLTAKIPS